MEASVSDPTFFSILSIEVLGIITAVSAYVLYLFGLAKALAGIGVVLGLMFIFIGTISLFVIWRYHVRQDVLSTD